MKSLLLVFLFIFPSVSCANTGYIGSIAQVKKEFKDLEKERKFRIKRINVWKKIKKEIEQLDAYNRQKLNETNKQIIERHQLLEALRDECLGNRKFDCE